MPLGSGAGELIMLGALADVHGRAVIHHDVPTILTEEPHVQ